MTKKTEVKNEAEVEVISYEIDGLSKDEAMTKLISIDKLTFKEATEYWKTTGSTVKGGVFQAFLNWLQESPRTQTELAVFILASGSPNEARWFGQRDAIRILSVEVFKKGGSEFTEAEATTAQREALKATFAK